MTKNITSEQIKILAQNLGFDLVGIAPAQPIPHQAYVRDWLNNNRQGQMRYLAQNLEKRLDPRLLVPAARSIICTALNYAPPPELAIPQTDPQNQPAHPVARYAWRADYHKYLKKKLKRLAQQIALLTPQPPILRCFVDSAPIAEKAHAAHAGLGWIGKNNLIINPKFGSWILLGEIVTDLDLHPDQPIPDQCGSCQKCLDACPTNALIAPRQLDPQRCASYLTIESDLPVPPKIAQKINPRIFGCDTCQLVCPYNQFPIPQLDPNWQPHPQNAQLTPKKIAQLTPEQFNTLFAGSPIRRADLNHLKTLAQAYRNHAELLTPTPKLEKPT